MSAPQTTDESPVKGTQAVERALKILLSFDRSTPELGISELGRQLGLNPSTVHRLVRALVANGFLEQSERSERYRLGLSAIILGQTAQHTYGLGQAKRILEAIGADTGESVNLGIRELRDVVVLLRMESQQALRFEQEPGTRVPLHASSMGKAALAFCEDLDLELDRIFARGPERFTDTTLVDREELVRELHEIRSRGYSVDNQESIPGVRCVGAPIVDSSGIARAAIAVQAPAVRMPLERVEQLGPSLREAAQKIAQVMGFEDG